MCADSCDLVCREIPLLNVVICACEEHCRLVNAPAYTQNGSACIPLKHHLRLHLIAGTSLRLVNRKVSIPECREKHRGTELLEDLVNRGELQAADGLLSVRWQRQLSIVGICELSLCLLAHLLLPSKTTAKACHNVINIFYLLIINPYQLEKKNSVLIKLR